MRERFSRGFSNGSLPDEAKRFLDTQKAEIANNLQNSDPRVRELYKRLKNLSQGLGIPEYSIKSFRNLHFFAKPDRSIGGLPVGDEVILELIWCGIYEISDLERGLQTGGISALTLNGSGHGEENFRELQRALQEWRASQGDSSGF